MLKKLYFSVTHKTPNFPLHLMLWVILLSVPFLDLVTRRDDFDLWLLLRFFIALALFCFNYLVLVPKLLIERKVALYMVTIIPLVLGLSYLSTYWTDFHGPMRNLPPDGDRHFFPSFVMRYLPAFVTFTIHALASTMSRLYIEWNSASKMQMRTQSEKRAAELLFLKAQLNPHFFFNSLNTIFSLSIKQSKQTPEAIMNLSNLMRYMLYETDKDVVRLEDDLQYLSDYIELSKLRLTANNKVNYEINGEPGSIFVPPLLFICFIENAFKHGTAPAKDTEINISFDISPQQIGFRVENTIHKERTAATRSGVGLENTLSRVNLYFPNRNFFSAFQLDGRYIVNLIITL
ncbi:MAG: hypothetical protein EOO50_05010 [Flavobacterium sp.]|uniref:sensor histidine kinase n=1 Tax=Flavobacterium sp. TaxID=239 RepID=UPI001201BBF5|nr:sensor histidine kinase [Flavobacterium sp.]RZJ67643.1 MAG: hypothetical protein EOO50_05010 [Flavobacterium sp.]